METKELSAANNKRTWKVWITGATMADPKMAGDSNRKKEASNHPFQNRDSSLSDVLPDERDSLTQQLTEKLFDKMECAVCAALKTTYNFVSLKNVILLAQRDGIFADFLACSLFLGSQGTTEEFAGLHLYENTAVPSYSLSEQFAKQCLNGSTWYLDCLCHELIHAENVKFVKKPEKEDRKNSDCPLELKPFQQIAQDADLIISIDWNSLKMETLRDTFQILTSHYIPLLLVIDDQWEPEEYDASYDDLMSKEDWKTIQDDMRIMLENKRIRAQSKFMQKQITSQFFV